MGLDNNITKAIGSRIRCKVMVRMFTLMEPVTMENGKTINIMEREYCPLRMGLIMKGSGKIMQCMEMVNM